MNASYLGPATGVRALGSRWFGLFLGSSILPTPQVQTVWDSLFRLFLASFGIFLTLLWLVGIPSFSLGEPALLAALITGMIGLATSYVGAQDDEICISYPNLAAFFIAALILGMIIAVEVFSRIYS